MNEGEGTNYEPVLLRPANVEAKDDLVFGENPTSSLVISKALLTKIWDQTRDGIRSLRQGGLEVGGLLVGRKVTGGSGVVVEEIIPLPIEYRQGPSFLMSSSDLATIPPAIESAHRGARVVVGFYRSRTRGDGVLRASDLTVLEAIERAHESYVDDFRCCFVLAPKSLSQAVACVALREENGWTELQPVTLQSNPVSIESPSLSSGITRPQNSPAEDKGIYAPVSRSNEITVSEQRVHENRASRVAPAQGRTRREGIWWCATLGVVAAAALGAVRQMGPSTSHTQQEAPRTHLSFSVTREAPVWKLTWNRAAIDSLHPVGGVLSVDDGVFEQQVPLALSDLASGTLIYMTDIGNLTFILRIDRGGSHVEEHVRVVVAPNMDTAPARSAGTRTSPDAVTPVPATKTSRNPIIADRANREASANLETAHVQPPKPVAPRAANLAPPEPRINWEVVAIPVPSAQPALVPARGPGSPPASTGNAIPRDAGGPGTTARVAARFAAAPTSSQLDQVQPKYVGPKPIRQLHPKVPADMPSGAQVQVNVDIDTRGNVSKVTPVRWSERDAPLVVWAVSAVSSWVFEPARLDGTAIPSQMNLAFRF